MENRKIIIAVILLLVTIIIIGRVRKINQENRETPVTAHNPEITITMGDESQIKLELYPENAPNTVNNFIALAQKGYYDQLIFHRVIKGFMIQGGDPTGTGTGGPGYMIKGEFKENGFANELKHSRGVISMARSSHPDSAGSQFFIVQQDATHLDGKYAAFGQVIAGIEVVDRIATTKTDFRDKPLEEQMIKKVTVETFGQKYPEPEKINKQ